MHGLKQDPDYINQVLYLLRKNYPKAHIALNFSNEWELLVAVILSAQCTDVMVNKVTPALFKKYPSLKNFADADIIELESYIRPTGFYHNKAKNIKAAANLIFKTYGGKLPKTMTEMLTIPGVARKTANVVLGNAFGIIEGVAVDTHVKRLSQRLGFTAFENPEKIEQDLMRLFAKKDWFLLTYLLIEHGRKTCEAKKPKCDQCFLNHICPSAFQFPHFQNKPSLPLNTP